MLHSKWRLFAAAGVLDVLTIDRRKIDQNLAMPARDQPVEHRAKQQMSASAAAVRASARIRHILLNV